MVCIKSTASRGFHSSDVGAVAGLPDVVAVSRVYETAPVGGPDQGPYLNCVVRLETDLDARALLDAAQERERIALRSSSVRSGPRIPAVDVPCVDGQTDSPPADSPSLTLN